MTLPRFLPVARTVAEWVLGLALVGILYVHFAPGGRNVSALVGQREVNVTGVPTCGTTTICITDDHSGDSISINCGTGAYTFIGGAPVVTISGTGTLRQVNGIEMLTDSKPDRRVSAGLLLGPGSGSATIYFLVTPGVWKVYRINQTVPFRACPGKMVAALKHHHHRGKHKHKAHHS
jgi:hypothetical protein